MNYPWVSDVPCGRDGPVDTASVGMLDVLARELGVAIRRPAPHVASCDVVQWARWKAPSWAGTAAPALPTGPWTSRVSAVVAALADLTGALGAQVDVDPKALLWARAREAGWSHGSAVSTNGSARLIPAADGWVALNLARTYDREVLPAVLAAPVPPGTEWAALSSWVGRRSGSQAVDALQQLGVPASVVGAHADAAALRIGRIGATAAPAGRAAPVVVDLSAMWAGPLVAHLLHRAGARVITVEDPARPDGARGGPPRFYADLHRGHELRAVDLRGAAGRAELAELVGSADIVLEASRPRALRGLGLHAEQFLGAAPGRTWVAITGYGRNAFDGMRVAFGDDAAAGGGLVACGADGAPVFAGDAIADPLTGLWAATAAVASWSTGGGHLLDVAMAGVAAEVAAPTTGSRHAHPLHRDDAGNWWVSHEDEDPVRC